VQRNARDWRGLVERDNDALVDDEGYVYGDVGEVRSDDETPSGQLAVGNGIQIAIVRPRNFRDAATVGEYYRQEIPVIINLEDLDKADATRIIDFVSGLILGLCGDIERISRRTFLIVPPDAAIITTHDGLTEEGFFNQALRPGSGGGGRAQCAAIATTANAHGPMPTRCTPLNRSCSTMRASTMVTPGYSDTITAAVASMLT